MQKLIVRDIKKEYPDIDCFDEKDFIKTIEDVYSENSKQLVIVLDEWDAVFRERQNDKEVWEAFSLEYVYGVFHDVPQAISQVYGLY